MWLAVLTNAQGKYNLHDPVKGFQMMEELAEGGVCPAQDWLGVWYGEGLGVMRNYRKSIDYHRKAFENEFDQSAAGSAANNLGWMYEQGFGVEVDFKKAKEWYEKAVGADEDTLALANLGRLYREGLGGAQNIDIAISLFERGLDREDSESELSSCNLRERRRRSS